MSIYKYLFNQKYRFFYKKTKEVQKAIWELEFKVVKSRQVREGVRQDRDRAVEAVNRIKVGLDTNVTKEQKENLEKELATMQENVTRYEAQMKMIDSEINGGSPTELSPDGSGILERIKAYIELREMYRDFADKV